MTNGMADGDSYMPLRITVELIPRGDEAAKRKVCVVDVTNDETGTSEIGNYRVEAHGVVTEGIDAGWDAFVGFPKRMVGVDRRRGYDHIAAKAMQLLMED
jgi:hypothetical protein